MFFKNIVSFAKDSIFSRIRDLELYDRVSAVMLLTGSVLATMALILGIAFRTPFIFNIPHLMVILLCLGLPLILKNNFSAVAHTALYFVALLYFPFIYYTNGGIDGTGPYYFMMIIVYFAFFRRGWKLLVLISGLVIFYFVVIFIGYVFPQIVTPYPDLITQHIDMAVSLMSVSAVLSIIASMAYKGYRSERYHAVVLARDLEARNKELEALSITDQLTGVYSRQFFMDKLKREICDFEQSGKKFYVMMIDIDHFKKVNDTYGHLYGDEILKLVARVIKDNLRHHDITARYGGEEFVALVTRTNDEDGYQIGERIRKGVENAKYRNEAVVTVSVGIAEYFCNESADDIIYRADQRMYAVKNNGRNGVAL